MEIKKFWKFYPKTKNKFHIAESRSKVSKKITESINIPTIGIGSSNFCDGQILVLDDLFYF